MTKSEVVFDQDGEPFNSVALAEDWFEGHPEVLDERNKFAGYILKNMGRDKKK